jgi:hypothetical protein
MSDMEWLATVDSDAVGRALGAFRDEARTFHVLALLPDAERGKVALIQDECRRGGVTVAGAVFPELGRSRRRRPAAGQLPADHRVERAHHAHRRVGPRRGPRPERPLAP